MKIRLLLIFMPLLLAGCSVLKSTSSLVDGARGLVHKSTSLIGLGPNKLEQVIILTTEASANNASVIELAFAYGEASGAVVTGTETAQWFEESKGFCASYSGELDVLRVELPAGYSALIKDLPERSKTAKQIMVYVRGIGKIDLTQSSLARLRIADGGLALEESLSSGVIPVPSMSTNIGVLTKC